VISGCAAWAAMQGVLAVLDRITERALCAARHGPPLRAIAGSVWTTVGACCAIAGALA
jgi:hypothetical protein